MEWTTRFAQLFIAFRECLRPSKSRELNEEVLAKLHGLIENLEAENEKRRHEADSYQSQVFFPLSLRLFQAALTMSCIVTGITSYAIGQKGSIQTWKSRIGTQGQDVCLAPTKTRSKQYQGHQYHVFITTTN